MTKACTAVLGLALLLLLPQAASAATITVNSAGDTAANDGACTLREAIDAANNDVAPGGMAGECAAGQDTPTVDTIAFNIAGAGPHVITPGTALPLLADPIEIDGGTDPDGEIEIDGTNVLTAPVINLLGAGCTVTKL